jgi:hypothetical protein
MWPTDLLRSGSTLSYYSAGFSVSHRSRARLVNGAPKPERPHFDIRLKKSRSARFPHPDDIITVVKPGGFRVALLRGFSPAGRPPA